MISLIPSLNLSFAGRNGPVMILARYIDQKKCSNNPNREDIDTLSPVWLPICCIVFATWMRKRGTPTSPVGSDE
jgi:hypothetical protein